MEQVIDANSARHMLVRDPGVKSCHGVPREKKRLRVTGEAIDIYFKCHAEVVEAPSVHFVGNMDESGHQESANCQHRVCCIPNSHTRPQVSFPVPPTEKRRTPVGYIAADESFLRLPTVIPRKTDDLDLALTGVTGEKVAAYSQVKGYMDRPIFLAWPIDIFLSGITRRCIVLGTREIQFSSWITAWRRQILDRPPVRTGLRLRLGHLCPL
jgi:hypothetical protein